VSTKTTKRSAARQAYGQALIYRKQPADFRGHQGQIAATLDALTVSDLRDLMPDGVSKSKDGKPAPKPLLIERFCQWVELGGQTEAKPAKASKAKPKKVKPDPHEAFESLTDVIGDLSPGGADLTTSERNELARRIAELTALIPVGTAKDDPFTVHGTAATKPTIRNIIECVNQTSNADGKPLPVSGPKAKLVERLAVYFGIIDPPATKKTVSRVNLSEFSDADLAAELERRRQASSPTHQLLAGGIC